MQTHRCVAKVMWSPDGPRFLWYNAGTCAVPIVLIFHGQSCCDMVAQFIMAFLIASKPPRSIFPAGLCSLCSHGMPLEINSM